MVAPLPAPSSYHAIARLGRSALAWEVLRRDPAYCEAYASLSECDVADDHVRAEFVSRWGLHFP